MFSMKFPWKILAGFGFVCLLTSATCNVTMDTKSIRPDLNTFFVEAFNSSVPDAPATIGRDFSDSLNDKIRSETRLSFSDIDPDLEFEGSVVMFNVSAQAPQAGETTQLSRLTIGINVKLTDNKDEEQSWEQRFTFFSDFDAATNLLDVQDALIEEIFEQLRNDIFDKAFGSW